MTRTRARSAGRLSTRALCRALLDRQLLLRRRRRPVLEVLERLVALQAQVPRDPYVALWSRVDRFAAPSLSDAMREREALRLTLLRGTLHMVTARDAVALRPLMQDQLGRLPWGQRLVREAADGLDRQEVLETFRRLIEERPRTRAELADEVRDRWPGRDVASLTIAMYSLPTVQVTPRGLWRTSGPSAFTTLERWLGPRRAPAASVEDLVRRYLEVFGPASPDDAQTWSGLPRLREVFERLRPELRTYVTEDGGELFDVGDGRLPDPATPAPVRLLPEYDNAVIGFADRSRILPPAVPRWSGVGWGTVLVDGSIAARWRLFERRDAERLRVEPFVRLSASDRSGIEAEATKLAAFLLDGRDGATIEIARPGR